MIDSEKFLIVSNGEIRKEWNIKWNFNASEDELSSLKSIIFNAFEKIYPAITIEYITTDGEEEDGTFLFGDEDSNVENKLIDAKEEFPYIKTKFSKYSYNPEFGDDRICECGHQYHRHFDSYNQMDPVGCKYCECYIFKEKLIKL